MQCADRDLIRRLSEERQHPETGCVFPKEKWDPDKKESFMKKSNMEEEEEEETTEDLEVVEVIKAAALNSVTQRPLYSPYS